MCYFSSVLKGRIKIALVFKSAFLDCRKFPETGNFWVYNSLEIKGKLPQGQIICNSCRSHPQPSLGEHSPHFWAHPCAEHEIPPSWSWMGILSFLWGFRILRFQKAEDSEHKRVCKEKGNLWIAPVTEAMPWVCGELWLREWWNYGIPRDGGTPKGWDQPQKSLPGPRPASPGARALQETAGMKPDCCHSHFPLAAVCFFGNCLAYSK